MLRSSADITDTSGGNKYLSLLEKEEEEVLDEDELAGRDAAQMCGNGTLLVGVGFGFVSGLCCSILTNSHFFTLVSISLASAFGQLGSQIKNPLEMNRKDFVFLSAVLLLVSLVLSILIPVHDNLGGMFIVTAVSAYITNASRPLFLIPLSMGYNCSILKPNTKINQDGVAQSC